VFANFTSPTYVLIFPPPPPPPPPSPGPNQHTLAPHLRGARSIPPISVRSCSASFTQPHHPACAQAANGVMGRLQRDLASSWATVLGRIYGPSPS
jgi:hypothetical protein